MKVVEENQQAFDEHVARKEDGGSMDDLFGWYDILWDCMTNVTNAERKLLAFDCEPYEELRFVVDKLQNRPSMEGRGNNLP